MLRTNAEWVAQVSLLRSGFLLLEGHDFSSRASGPAYWKNGTQFPLIGSDATQIVVSTGNVYVSGVNFPTSPIFGNLRGKVTSISYLGATYWENTNPNPLAPNADSSDANAIAVVVP
jgi:hypothetical protein